MNVSFKQIGSFNSVGQYSSPLQRTSGAQSSVVQSNTVPNQKNKNDKKNDIIKYLAIIAGIGIGILAGIKGIKKIISNRNAKKLIDNNGNTHDPNGMEPMLARVCELPGVRQLLPEIERLVKSTDDKIQRVKQSAGSFEEFNKVKKHMDLDYYKDSFRLGMTMSADRLKALRNADQAKFSDVFTKSRIFFQTEDGLLIYGKNEAEKQKLKDYFINEAKAHDIDVEYISTKGVTRSDQIGEILNNTFVNAKKKFNEQKKHTLIVMEDVDFILRKDGISTRAIWNRVSHKSGQDGVITLTTAQDIKMLDDSCVRGGRIRYWIDIDDALAKQAELEKQK